MHQPHLLPFTENIAMKKQKIEMLDDEVELHEQTLTTNELTNLVTDRIKEWIGKKTQLSVNCDFCQKASLEPMNMFTLRDDKAVCGFEQLYMCNSCWDYY